VEQCQHRNIIVPRVPVEAAFVVERFGASFEQCISAGDARRGLTQPLTRQAVVAIAVRADDLNHTFEHLTSGICRVGYPAVAAFWIYRGRAGAALMSVSSPSGPGCSVEHSRCGSRQAKNRGLSDLSSMGAGKLGHDLNIRAFKVSGLPPPTET
jgi:hypothetical protein